MSDASPASRGSKRGTSGLPSEIPPGTALSQQSRVPGAPADGQRLFSAGGASTATAEVLESPHDTNLVFLETCLALEGTASLHHLPFITALYQTFQSGWVQRGTRLAGCSLGHAPAPRSVLDTLLAAEDDPCSLWLRADHRDRMGLVRLAIGKALGLPMFDAEEDLGAAAVCDFFMDALRLAVQRSFTDLQTQRCLLLMQQTYRDVIDLPNTEPEDGEALLEGPVARKLTKRLTVLTTRAAIPCVTTKTVIETQRVERPDAAAVAAIEAKRDAAKGNKKVLAQLEEQLKAVPLVIVEQQVPKEVEEAKEVIIPPTFSCTDGLHMGAFLSESLLQHWRLFWTAARRTRAIHTTEFTAPIWDLPLPTECPTTHVLIPLVPPPLSTALPLADYQRKCERDELWAETEAAITESYQLLYEDPVKTLHECVRMVVESTLKEQEALAEADRRAAMTGNEFEDAVRVLSHRISKRSQKNKDVLGPASILHQTTVEQPPAPAPATAAAPIPRPPSAVKAQPSPLQQRSNSVVTFQTTSDDAVVGFDAADIELRLQKISEVLTNGPGGNSRPNTTTAATPKKK